MTPVHLPVTPDFRWCTFEGSRDLDRILDRQLTFLEILEWQEDAETMSLFMQEQREKRAAAKAAGEATPLAASTR